MNPFHSFLHHMHDRHGPLGHSGRHGHRDHHVGRRGHHGHGFGSAHGFPGDSPQGLGGFGQGRKLTSGDLQLLILAMLAERARHGYELIKELEQRSKGFYVPSPGMVYPSLSYLEEIGYASVEANGAKKLYTITVAGLGHLDANRTAVDAMWAQLTWFGDRMDRMREAMSDDTGAAPADAADPFGFGSRGERTDRGERGRGGRGRGERSPFGAEVHEAVHGLMGAMRDIVGAGVDEQRRIVDILARAAAEIRKR